MRTKEITSKIMSSIKSKDKKPEKILGAKIWGKGLRYRKHYKTKGSIQRNMLIMNLVYNF